MGFIVVVAAALSTGCGSSGSFVWASQLRSDEVGAADYAIVAGDVVSIRVFGQDAMSTHAKVRSDGKVSMPFLGDVLVVGKTPAAVAREMELGLKSFINSPNVTVTVDEFQPTTVAVLGEVAHPGVIAMDRNAGVLQALANAGGLTETASRDDIYVLRETPVPRRIRFTFDLLTKNPPAATFRLRPGDVVVVE
ncbi:MAG TPA: polysaccharide biosynthesis/export family protein [Polyangiaceae bacterium]|jgi:polysaccharide export outer membrane protein|nr:polysaccharide biosynthesis/export family protein [Polyangiaceae bacterium]